MAMVTRQARREQSCESRPYVHSVGCFVKGRLTSVPHSSAGEFDPLGDVATVRRFQEDCLSVKRPVARLRR